MSEGTKKKKNAAPRSGPRSGRVDPPELEPGEAHFEGAEDIAPEEMPVVADDPEDRIAVPYSLVPWGTSPDRSRGRLHEETESSTRTVFQRDRDRILHSTAFRRLKHKTQVFVYHEGDHYRTRLTHSLEVSQIARSLARALGLDEDLAESLSLAHDLGHPPFGHAGEEALDAAMKDLGGFDHNAQTLKILTRLEQRYAGFDGLNLTWESLEGVVKHNGPQIGPRAENGDDPLPKAIKDYNETHDLELQTFAGPEAQVAALSDDIAYNNHDIDDGLRAELFTVDDLRSVPLFAEMSGRVEAEWPDLEQPRLIHETVRRMIEFMVNDVLAETRRRVEAAEPENVDDIRALDAPVVAFSEEMVQYDRDLRDFLYEHMYRHHRVNRMTSKARRVVTDLVELFMDEPGCLPAVWRDQTDGKKSAATGEAVADYVAGMTDWFALKEHKKLLDPYA